VRCLGTAFAPAAEQEGGGKPPQSKTHRTLNESGYVKVTLARLTP
jgi:hypothetical protein